MYCMYLWVRVMYRHTNAYICQRFISLSECVYCDGIYVQLVNKQSILSDGVCHYVSVCKLSCTCLNMEPKDWCIKTESTMYSCVSMSSYELLYCINYEKHTFKMSCFFLLSLNLLSKRLDFRTRNKWCACRYLLDELRNGWTGHNFCFFHIPPITNSLKLKKIYFLHCLYSPPILFSL